MRRILLFTLLFMLWSPARLFTLAQSNPVDEVILLVNSVRISYGLPAYQVDYALMAAAQAQATWSAANNHIGHDGPGGSSPVDRAIAAGVSTDRFKAAIARATLTMAKTLNLEVVAEGVETLADLLWLERAGCPMIQGWVFSRALNVQQALNLLRDLREPRAD